MRRPLATLCLILLAFPAAASRIVAQEPASEADRALLAAAANFEAANSWRADFAFALQIDGDLALPGLSASAEMDVLVADGSFTFIDSGSAFALDASLAIPLLRFFLFPEAPGERFELEIVYQEGALHIALDDGVDRINEVIPLDVAALVGMGTELGEEAAEWEAAFMVLAEEHSELWRLPDAAGLTILQSQLDARALALDPALPSLLIDMLQQLDGSMSESAPRPNDASDITMDLYTGDFSELAIALDMAQLLVDEAEVRMTYSIDAEDEELRALALEAEVVVNLAAVLALGLVDDGAPPLNELDGELRFILSGEATLSGYGEALLPPNSGVR